jgi:hypothetical protein
MELPKDLSWEITTNEKGVEMITMPRFKMNEIVEYLKYAETELKKLRVDDVTKSSPLIEGKTKSNVKNNTQIERLAPPPPPIKR